MRESQATRKRYGSKTYLNILTALAEIRQKISIRLSIYYYIFTFLNSYYNLL